MNPNTLTETTNTLAMAGKGILAADESVPTVSKRLEAVGVVSTEASRRAYRELLLTTPGLNRFISGVILFEETLNQTTADGMPFPQLLAKAGILTGIKVDKGLVPLPNTDQESITQGLDGLAERLTAYKAKGAQFAKWRAVTHIDALKPSHLAIEANAEVLARYAAHCQAQDIVPIVEPEVLLSGTHTIERCAEVTESVLKAVFVALSRHHVDLKYLILKPSMVIEGDQCPVTHTEHTVAQHTLITLLKTVPKEVPSINFLSGGQSPERATRHLAAMNAINLDKPWRLSFSYARALQAPCLAVWGGKPEQAAKAQQVLLEKARENALAASNTPDIRAD